MADQSVPPEESRIAIAVAVHVLGLSMEVVSPSWYDREVYLFRYPGSAAVDYSWDSSACNAMMFRNGVDESQGFAQPLPFYDSEIDRAWSEVLPYVKDRGALSSIAELDADEAAEAICRPALGEAGWVERP